MESSLSGRSAARGVGRGCAWGRGRGGKEPRRLGVCGGRPRGAELRLAGLEVAGVGSNSAGTAGRERGLSVCLLSAILRYI